MGAEAWAVSVNKITRGSGGSGAARLVNCEIESAYIYIRGAAR